MISGFFDETDVYAEDFARFAAGILSNGVLADSEDNLKVTPSQGMVVSVKPGYCWINGHFGKCEIEENVTISPASGMYDRYDRIIARLNLSENKVSIEIIEGTASLTPVVPDIVRDGTYYDLCLAVVHIRAGALSITANDITDTRQDGTVCGGCLMRTGVVLDLTDKVSKEELAAERLRIDKNAEDIAVQAERTLLRKGFEGGSGEQNSKYCSVSIPGDFYGVGVIRFKVTVTVNSHDTTVEDNNYVRTGSAYFTLIGIGDSVNENISMAEGSTSRKCNLTASITESGITVTSMFTDYDGRYEAIDKTTITVSDIFAVVMT